MCVLVGLVLVSWWRLEPGTVVTMWANIIKEHYLGLE